MKRLFIKLSVCVFFIVVIASCKIFYNYLQPATAIDINLCVSDKSDTLEVCLVGDSWVEFLSQNKSKLRMILEDSLKESVIVTAYGHGGAKSKLIYHDLFLDENPIKRNPKYCFVSAGINDAVTKMSKSFYANNMRLIISKLKENDIKPIVMELPPIDYCPELDRLLFHIF